MDNISAYKAWVPQGDEWSKWAKPVLFAEPPVTHYTMYDQDLSWADKLDTRTAVILDLPGIQGIEEGLALARAAGYRPVPLYNGVKPPRGVLPLVEVNDIISGLYEGAAILPTLRLRRNAPPAFLLDCNRMQGRNRSPGKFDNRWSIFPQDMPSANYLLDHGIQKVVVRTVTSMNDDLKHVLYRYQESGLAIQRCIKNETVRKETIHKPNKFRSTFYRLGVIAGLTRSAVGGFGGIIPTPSERTYGHG